MSRVLLGLVKGQCGHLCRGPEMAEANAGEKHGRSPNCLEFQFRTNSKGKLNIFFILQFDNNLFCPF
jgi:hypothetical protein